MRDHRKTTTFILDQDVVWAGDDVQVGSDRHLAASLPDRGRQTARKAGAAAEALDDARVACVREIERLEAERASIELRLRDLHRIHKSLCQMAVAENPDMLSGKLQMEARSSSLASKRFVRSADARGERTDVVSTRSAAITTIIGSPQGSQPHVARNAR